MTSDTPTPLTLEITAAVIDELGVNLYGSTPPALAESVTNAWDADATSVLVTAERGADSITIVDDGHGMTRHELQSYYLTVGHHRRDRVGGKSSRKLERDVMGRKGIGKLALLSIGKVIEVHTATEDSSSNLHKTGVILDERKIRDDIKNDRAYHPEEITAPDIALTSPGTTIVVRELRRKVTKATIDGIKTRLARRFAILGSEHQFVVKLNGDEITSADRGYFKKIQYLWSIGEVPSPAKEEMDHVREERRAALPAPDEALPLKGWVGSVEKPSDLDGGQGIALFARGRVVHENVLKQIPHAGTFMEYLVGEIHDDLLDDDDLDDIATADRHRVQTEDARFTALERYLRAGALTQIEREWKAWRNADGGKRAGQLPSIRAWIDSKPPDRRKLARSLVSVAANAELPNEDQRADLYRNAIIAYESLDLRERLDVLQDASDEELQASLASVFSGIDELENAYAAQASRAKVQVLEELDDKLEANDLERVIQDHLHGNLWLIEPEWSNPAYEAEKEVVIKNMLEKAAPKLREEEQNARLDLSIRSAAGKFIVVELKRYLVATNYDQLSKQLRKYHNALKKGLPLQYGANVDYEIVVVLGPNAGKLEDEEVENLARFKSRIVRYGELMSNGRRRYSEYLDARKARLGVEEIVAGVERELAEA